MEVNYYDYRQGGAVFMSSLIKVLETNKIKTVLEIGSSKYPMLSKSFAAEYGIDLSVMDISAEDITTLASENDYIKNHFVHDITTPFETDLKFDLIISKFIWEHIEHIDLFHLHIHQLLEKDGHAIHYFPCLSTLPFVSNYFLPSNLSEKILDLVDQREKDKYPAYYKWCYGPSKKNVYQIESTGYAISSYLCFFGHNYYEKNLKLLHYLELLKIKLLLQFPSKHFCSYSLVVLRKIS